MLIKNQQQLIEHLEGKLAEKDLTDPLTARGSSTTDAAREVGPGSIPLKWPGAAKDAIQLTLDDHDLSAHILTKQMVKDWNNMLRTQAKIDVYDWSIVRDISIVDRMQAEIEDEYDTYCLDAATKEKYQNVIDDREARMADIPSPKIQEFQTEMWDARTRGYCAMRHFLQSGEMLEKEDNVWMRELWETAPESQKLHDPVQPFDPKVCPFEPKLDGGTNVFR